MRIAGLLLAIAGLLLAIVCSFALNACGAGSGGSDDRMQPDGDAPNIVFVLLDDATKDQVNAETMPFTHRYMRRNGTTFTDYIVTSPLCCPARASIITGQYGTTPAFWPTPTVRSTTRRTSFQPGSGGPGTGRLTSASS